MQAHGSPKAHHVVKQADFQAFIQDIQNGISVETILPVFVVIVLVMLFFRCNEQCFFADPQIQVPWRWRWALWIEGFEHRANTMQPNKQPYWYTVQMADVNVAALLAGRGRAASLEAAGAASSGENMSSDHIIWCDHTFPQKWTFVHTIKILITPSKFWSHP